MKAISRICVWVIVASLAAIIWQTTLLLQLRKQNQDLKAVVQNQPRAAADLEHQQQLVADLKELRNVAKENAELHALEAESSEHRTNLARLPELAAEHKRLLEQQARARANTAALSDEEFFKGADEKAKRFECMTHIKQLCLAARVWSNDNEDIMPVDYLTMYRELNDPRILICPSDTSRAPAENWQTFTPANASYQIISPGVSEADPEVVYVRCMIHGSVGLVDGSATMLSPSFQVIQKDGKWKLGRVSYE